MQQPSCLISDPILLTDFRRNTNPGQQQQQKKICAASELCVTCTRYAEETELSRTSPTGTRVNSWTRRCGQTGGRRPALTSWSDHFVGSVSLQLTPPVIFLRVLRALAMYCLVTPDCVCQIGISTRFTARPCGRRNRLMNLS